jgi:SAM-dependent methyltransferase
MVSPEIVDAVATAMRTIPPLPSGLSTMQPGNPTYAHRIEFDASLVLGHASGPYRDRSVLDLGGGVGAFSITLALLGVRSLIADDFYGWPNDLRKDLFTAFDKVGVEVLERELLAEPLDVPDGSLDAVTSFHFLEHLHRSPKDIFRQAVDALRPGGTFVVAGPNRANARKRITGLVGKGAWSPMEEWYEQPVFRGHVREPDVGDLTYITRDLGLDQPSVYGRNFLGESHEGLMGEAARLSDPVLRRFPGLCSDIYAVAHKPC